MITKTLLALALLFGVATAVITPPGYPNPIGAFFFSTVPTILGWGEAVTIQNRFVVYADLSAWDAQTVFHGSAKPYLPEVADLRRPASEHSEENRITAALYAVSVVTNYIVPAVNTSAVLESLGLDPTYTTRDPNTPAGLGLMIGDLVVSFASTDGSNQDGKIGGCEYNCQAYADYTGYYPVNTPLNVVDADRWQPLLVEHGVPGLVRAQQHVTPHWRFTRPWAHANPGAILARPPRSLPSKGMGKFLAETEKVINAVGGLTDRQKAISQFFDNKVYAFGNVLFQVTAQFNLDPLEFTIFDFGSHMAVADSAISCWGSKIRYDTIRPITAVRNFLADNTYTAYGGPGVGTTQVKGRDFRGWMPTSAHAEYPSGTSCFCTAYAEFTRQFLGTDNVTVTVAYPKGGFGFEAGAPAEDISVVLTSLTQMEEECGQSRLWGGVHFQDAIDSSQKLCRRFGRSAARKARSMLPGLRFPKYNPSGAATAAIDEDDDE